MEAQRFQLRGDVPVGHRAAAPRHSAGMAHRVVIIGGGFAGLDAAQRLKQAPAQITLVDRRNFHLFQPLLYQVATGSLSPANIASPLRAVLSDQENTQVLLAEVTGIDVARRRVLFSGGMVEYDTLIVATGSTHHYFGRSDWEAAAPGLKTIEDATEIRARIFSAFESAERECDPAQIAAWLTFVIVGGGPTGVELAGALADIAKRTLTDDFRRIDPTQARILLLEASARILSTYPTQLSDKANSYLSRLGVSVQTGATVTDLSGSAVTVKRGERSETIATRTIVWAAGVRASSLGKSLEQNGGATLDRAGRVVVQDDFSLAGHPEIFVIGDLASYTPAGGNPLPGIAPAAQQAGDYVAKVIQCRLAGKAAPRFHYRDRGSMAIVGRGHAIADFGRFQMSGFAAWLAWLFVHLLQIVEFRNRVLVLVQWGWYYIRRSRSARLITGKPPN